ncbi:RagB/SusD family nutrient uptake outer membrane protein [Chitinophaga nivalis]|uniref:RagB/SusD family nutrient uptake outer membrane protein n=1 Tax=Chitinophaga nivalis TaxID=2991709 RepID=A0ABT3IKR7_9BACT|nr:RagB/SusD family nutrient uptake outer membrane protein [Chitinophaga nivalis]MCW3465750.1 RagB/SusD family nutrient uptake outer membrane protein [Chitinophaga nivalis]MCW3484559.1 RagB/SusD family nutrient uptake outer membrane protein [Chitinophaga nivalis]
MKLSVTTTILTIAAALVSCSKSFIDLPPVSNQTTSTFFKTSADFQQGVNAIYDGLQSNRTYGKSSYYLMEIRSDNTDIFDRGANAGIASQIDLFTEITTNPFLTDVYAGSYVTISRANAVLDQVDGAAIPDNDKKQFKGEALFLRALVYFDLVRLYGKVPLVIKTETTSESLNDKRNEVTEVYARIEQDLQTAATLLPAAYTNGNDYGRATALAANGLLGKVLVTEKKWAAATTVLNKVLNNASLLPEYAALYTPANVVNAETLFAVRFKKGLSPSEGNTYFSDMVPVNFYFNGISYGGSNNNRPTKDLVKAYEAGDKRLAASLDTTSYANATTVQRGNYVKKYLDAPAATNDAGSSFPILRYADVLLLAAEALNEQGYSAGGPAFDYLNQVRRRADIGEKKAVDLPDQTSFRDAIFRERRVELAFENNRWFDLIRYQKGLTIMQAHLQQEYGLATPVLTTNRLLFAIPQSEIDIHNDPVNFPQNP